MDRITDLPIGTNNLCEIDVFMCKLTKYTFLVPQRANATAMDFAKAYFDTVFRHHGFPARIISDRDPLFTSEFWKHLSALAGTKLNLSSTYHPQTDSETERRNRTIEQVLRAFLNNNQSNWVELLPAVEFAINSTIQDGTQFSPIELVSGHRPILPMTFLNAAASQFKSRPLEEFILHRSNAIKAVQDHLRIA